MSWANIAPLKKVFIIGEIVYDGMGNNYGEVETDRNGNVVIIHWKKFVVDE